MRYSSLFDQKLNWTGVFAGAGAGFVAGCLIWLIDAIERRAGKGPAPNAIITKICVAAVPLVFWVPLVGFLFVSFALYRTHWLNLPNWLSFVLVCFFYLAVAITLVWGLIFVMEYVVA